MAKSIVIVESPTKVKTINKFLGKKYKVVSSMGHLVDLPKSTLGVDLKNNFEPRLIVVRNKQKILKQLKKDAEKATQIYVATDPDREGEAIGWNLINQIGEGKEILRVTFQEITKEAVLRAFENPRDFDNKRINAQVARRVLDRIVGYKISPLLWKKVGSRLSAGRVQSVALRIIVERERAIQEFQPKEYWQFAVDLKKPEHTDVLQASLEKIGGEKFQIDNEKDAQKVKEAIQQEEFKVAKITKRTVKRKPTPPLITSTMQQEAFNKLKFNGNKTMMVAQQLYEGIELGDGETVGLITYMRTDSINVSKEALAKVRDFIFNDYGKDYLPEKPNKYKSKKSAQEAHEAIRPTGVLRKPTDIKPFLNDDQYKLYELIWSRFVRSQMTPAIYNYRKMEIIAGPYQFGASASSLAFDGHLVVSRDDAEEEKKLDISHYKKNDRLDLLDVRPTQHFTKPPPRFSDASLVKALEEDGIGRPSTYASIVSTLVYRNYVIREKGYFSPTELGVLICDLLVEYFPREMDIGFTAKMEGDLDLIEEGKLNPQKLLKEFYTPFKKELDYAESNIVKTQNFIEKHCPECGRKMVVKWGRRGRFVSCSGFPKCKYAEPFSSGVKCPAEDCDGELVERRSSRGQAFYGCSKYPACTYITKKLPEEE
jgi:DNA topoisomerase-1